MDMWRFFRLIPFLHFYIHTVPPKALPAASNARPPTSVVLPAAVEALPAASKACSSTLEAFAVTS